jgi:methylmalonyl-CoA mutase, C-terminal domain
MELIKLNGQEQVRVFIGGIIPDEDIPDLLQIGVAGVYGPGTRTEDIINDIHNAVTGSQHPV